MNIRIHGRGGQGTVAAGQIIAKAAWQGGMQVQSFPFFGVERSGSPVAAFVRIDSKKIKVREQIKRPDIIIIQDHRLISLRATLEGIYDDTKVVINTSEDAAKTGDKIRKIFPGFSNGNLYAIDASSLAKNIASDKMSNIALISFACSKVLGIERRHLEESIRDKFKDKGAKIIDDNIRIAEAAFTKI